MTAANSCTVNVDTEGEFVTVESVTVGVTGSNFTGFTANSTYTIQIINQADLKISDAIFPIKTKIPFPYTADSENDLYIRTQYGPCTLAILENPSASS